MREILFRGKTKKGKWVEGYYCPCVISGFPALPCIIGKERLDNGIWEPIQVIPESVGQFTGLTDKNGKKIFEGDIVVVRHKNGEICSIGDVQFSCGVFGVEWVHTKESRSLVGVFGQRHNLRRFDDNLIEEFEVVGNCWENPELLEVTE